jgi:NADPH:quinone reductase-like Zn-dependent oxidoreductase
VTAFGAWERVFGYCGGRFGAHAEYMAIAENGWIATLPSNLTFEQAAPGTEGSHYALSFIRIAKVHAGQDVLVYGATGAIGSAAVQLLRSLGVTVTAVCDTAHLELVRGLGAERVIDYTAEDFTRHGTTYNAVFDAVGKSTFGRCRRLLKPGGIYLSSELGPLAQNPFLALVTPLFRRRKVRFPFPTSDRTVGDLLQGPDGKRRVHPLIDRRYPLEQIVEAYRYVETGQKIGNVVITVVP